MYPFHDQLLEIRGVDMAQPLPQRYGDVNHWREAAQRATDRGDTELALSCWNHVRRLQPDALDALFHAACCIAKQGESERAGLMFDVVANHAQAPLDLRRRAARLLGVLEASSPNWTLEPLQ